jgi:hypothetical protein
MTAIDNAIVGKAFDSGDSPPTIQVWVVLSANAYEEYEAGELRQVRGPQDYFVTWSRL